MKTNYGPQCDRATVEATARALRERINAASDAASLHALESRLVRHYDAGTLDAAALRRLDDLVMRRLARLD